MVNGRLIWNTHIRCGCGLRCGTDASLAEEGKACQRYLCERAIGSGCLRGRWAVFRHPPETLVQRSDGDELVVESPLAYKRRR